MTAAGPAPGPATAPVRHHVAALTGLRALAALSVAGTHAFFWTGGYTDDAVGRFGARLEIGVALFFALSGYLLTRPWVRAAAQAGARRPRIPGTAEYLRRRARRILPAYWVIVTVVYVVYRFRDAGPFGRGPDGYLRNMTLTQIYGYGHLHDALTQMWSLAVEASFYLVLPLLGWGITRLLHGPGGTLRTGRTAAFVAAIALVSPAWIAATHTDGFYRLPGLTAARVDVTAQLWLPSFLVWFAGGMITAVLEPWLRSRGFPRMPWLFNSVCLTAAGAAFVVACTPAAGENTIMPSTTGAALVKTLLYTVCAVGALAPLALSRPRSPAAEDGRRAAGGAYSAILSWRPLVWLGSVSYEFFLVHLLIMGLMMDALGYRPFHGSVFTLFEVTVLLSVPASWLLARLTQPSALHSRSRNDASASTAIAGPARPCPGGDVPAGAAVAASRPPRPRSSVAARAPIAAAQALRPSSVRWPRTRRAPSSRP